MIVHLSMVRMNMNDVQLFMSRVSFNKIQHNVAYISDMREKISNSKACILNNIESHTEQLYYLQDYIFYLIDCFVFYIHVVVKKKILIF